jgi:Ca-activated chloride channel family protein
MFQFANPAYLLLTLAVPPLMWCWLRQRRNTLRHPSAELLTGLPVGRARAARWSGALLRGAGLVLLAVALAGPRWPDLRTRIDTEGIALVMLVDVSGSMAEPDFEWQGQPVSRLEAVKRVFRLFVEGENGSDGTPDGKAPRDFEGRATDLIGLVAFARRPETVCPLTLSHSALLRLLDREQPRGIPGESETNISDAVALGLHRLYHASPGRKVLVLLTDGEHNVPGPESGWTPRQVAQIAASLHVPIYAIDAGSDVPSSRESADRNNGSPGESAISRTEIRREAVKTLKNLAHISGGRYFKAGDTATLLKTCRAIDKLERSEIQSFQYRRYHEGYPWLGLGAFLLWSAALTLEMTVWRRIPSFVRGPWSVVRCQQSLPRTTDHGQWTTDNHVSSCVRSSRAGLVPGAAAGAGGARDLEPPEAAAGAGTPGQRGDAGDAAGGAVAALVAARGLFAAGFGLPRGGGGRAAVGARLGAVRGAGTRPGNFARL